MTGIASPVAAFGWAAIIRLGIAQFCLGAIVVLTTSTLNRVMVIELALPAILPGLLVALHYAVQLLRPRMGYGSDMMGRCTPWVLGGMTVLGIGGVVAAAATAVMASHLVIGVLLAVIGFAAIGIGVSASGTAVLVLLAKRVEARRRAAAATIVWLMMISGLAITAGLTGKLLDPYSHERLLTIAAAVSVLAIAITCLALYRLEGRPGSINQSSTPQHEAGTTRFRDAIMQVWREDAARRFTIFVFVSMLAFSAQDLILEPFAGLVFNLTPGQTTSLSGLQHAGVLCGMVLVAFACGRFGGRSESGSIQENGCFTRFLEQRKGVAADATHLRVDDALHKCAGDRCINRIAAAPQDLCACFYCNRFWSRNDCLHDELLCGVNELYCTATRQTAFILGYTEHC
jgi:BCD family chlorophyll transporter-like MFS transporter